MGYLGFKTVSHILFASKFYAKLFTKQRGCVSTRMSKNQVIKKKRLRFWQFWCRKTLVWYHKTWFWHWRAKSARLPFNFFSRAYFVFALLRITSSCNAGSSMQVYEWMIFMVRTHAFFITLLWFIDWAKKLTMIEDHKFVIHLTSTMSFYN